MVHGLVNPVKIIIKLLQGIDEKLLTLERGSFYPWIISSVGYIGQLFLGGAVVVFLESLYKELAAYIGSLVFDAFPQWALSATTSLTSLSMKIFYSLKFKYLKYLVIDLPIYTACNCILNDLQEDLLDYYLNF